jgi:TfoX/Sxy family transcriptional regulator of competence genes
LATIPDIKIVEKKMFGGLAFMINNKMCVNVGEDLLMCRFDPELTEELSKRTGFMPMIMKGSEYKGYCYVRPVGYKTKKDFEFWINLCLDYNAKAKSSKKKINKKVNSTTACLHETLPFSQ